MKILKKEIDVLKLDKQINEILKNNDIDLVAKLCSCTRTELSNMGLSNSQINKIIIKLELQGVDLKPNKTKRNKKIIENRVLITTKL